MAFLEPKLVGQNVAPRNWPRPTQTGSTRWPWSRGRTPTSRMTRAKRHCSRPNHLFGPDSNHFFGDFGIFPLVLAKVATCFFICKSKVAVVLIFLFWNLVNRLVWMWCNIHAPDSIRLVRAAIWKSSRCCWKPRRVLNGYDPRSPNGWFHIATHQSGWSISWSSEVKIMGLCNIEHNHGSMNLALQFASCTNMNSTH